MLRNQKDKVVEKLEEAEGYATMLAYASLLVILFIVAVMFLMPPQGQQPLCASPQPLILFMSAVLLLLFYILSEVLCNVIEALKAMAAGQQ